MPQILRLFQNIRNTALVPVAGVFGVVAVLSACPLESQSAGGRDFPLPQDAGDPPRAVALRAQLENHPHHRGCLLIFDQISTLGLEVAVGDLGGQPLAGHALIAEYGPYLLRGVLCIPLVDDISERGKIVHLVVAVHAVVDGDKADVHLREPDFRVQPHLQIVPAKPGHIFYDHGADLSRLYIGKHLLKAGPVERYPAIPVIHIKFEVRIAVVAGVFLQDLLLMGDAVAVPLVLVVPAEAAVQGRPLFHDGRKEIGNRCKLVKLPVQDSDLHSGSYRGERCSVDTYIIPKCAKTVEKSDFSRQFPRFGFHVNQTLDFINRGTALFLKMGGHNIGRTANPSLCLCWRHLFGTGHALTSLNLK